MKYFLFHLKLSNSILALLIFIQRLSQIKSIIYSSQVILRSDYSVHNICEAICYNLCTKLIDTEI